MMGPLPGPCDVAPAVAAMDASIKASPIERLGGSSDRSRLLGQIGSESRRAHENCQDGS